MGIHIEELAGKLQAGDKAALARALSLVERDAAAAARLLEVMAGARGHAHVIGITGPPGAGKSTLVGALVRALLAREHSVAVLAVDPSSPVSGGALLGDRFRIGEAIDGKCFVRSTASRGNLGGLTAGARGMIRLMDLAGYDLVIVETVGTGQSEIDVAHLADTLLVAFPPGLGDEMQAIKAGILELADMLVVTKADTPAARQACDALHAVTHLWRHAPPLHAVSAVSGEGIAALVQAMIDRARGGNSRRAAARPAAALPQRFARVWRRVEASVAATAGLDVAVSELGADLLRIDIAPRGVGNSFLLGSAAGAIAALASEEGMRCTDARHDPRGVALVLQLVSAS